jgi:hypothetical protein
MLKLGFAPLMVGVLAVSQGACGGGSAAGDASVGLDAPIARDAPRAWDGANPGDFISGDVGGVTIRAELDAEAGTIGLADGQIWVAAGTTSSTRGWTIYLTNSVGTTACPPAWIMLAETGYQRTDYPGGTCSLTVTRAAPALGDVLEGTFSATLATTSGQTVSVTNGVFRVTRTHS